MLLCAILHLAGLGSLILVHGIGIRTLCCCIAVSALIRLSIADWHTYEIPIQYNRTVLFAGSVNLLADPSRWQQYIVGMFCISLPLLLLLIVSKGKAIGGGDVKLVFAAGLLLGCPDILIAFFIACILGSLIHTARMIFAGAGRKLAFGAYLSAGIWMAMIWGESAADWYLARMTG